MKSNILLSVISIGLFGLAGCSVAEEEESTTVTVPTELQESWAIQSYSCNGTVTTVETQDPIPGYGIDLSDTSDVSFSQSMTTLDTNTFSFTALCAGSYDISTVSASQDDGTLSFTIPANPTFCVDLNGNQGDCTNGSYSCSTSGGTERALSFEYTLSGTTLTLSHPSSSTTNLVCGAGETEVLTYSASSN
jgi:hypothetical protein